MIWPPHQDVRPSWGQPAMGAFPQQSQKVRKVRNLNSDKVIQNVSQLCSVAAVGIKVGWGNVEVNVLLRFWSQCSSQKDRQKCYKCRKSSYVLSITSLWRNSDITLQSVYQNGSKFCIFLIFFSCLWFVCKTNGAPLLTHRSWLPSMRRYFAPALAIQDNDHH